MNKINFFIISLSIFCKMHVLQSNSILLDASEFYLYEKFMNRLRTYELESWEDWWEKNLGQKIQTFALWLGDEDAESRRKARIHIKNHEYKSILDIPSGLCTDYFGFKKDGIDINYSGVDITPKLVERGNQLGLNIKLGSIRSIPFNDNIFDIAYARHILEHLDYYDKAINELIRVAKKEVFIVFFIKPDYHSDKIDLWKVDNSYIYHNSYSIDKMMNFVSANPKVKTIQWEDVNLNECILHVYLK